MLRSIGHVFEKVDCSDDAEKKAWAKSAWQKWKRERIFRDFIEPTRNRLLKEFQDGLTLANPGVSLPALVAGAPGGIATVVAIDSDALEDSEGRKMIKLFDDAVAFWERVLPKTDDNWDAS
jgi:hypothetical protein